MPDEVMPLFVRVLLWPIMTLSYAVDWYRSTRAKIAEERARRGV